MQGRLPALFAGTAMLVGCGVLCGWYAGIDVLKRGVEGFVATNPLTAIAIIASASSILLYGRFRAAASRCVAGLVILIGFVKLCDLVFHCLPVDAFIFAEKVGLDGRYINRMAPNTAFAVFLSGLSVWLLNSKKREIRVLARVCAAWMLIIPFFVSVGYLFKISTMSSVGSHIPMAIPTVFSLFLIGFAIILTRPEDGFARMLRDEGAAGTIVRNIIPLAMAIPVLSGFIRLWSQQRGLMDRDGGIAIQITIDVVVICSFLAFSAVALHRTDQARRAKERELALSEQFNRLIASANPDGIVLLDGQANVAYLNSAFCAACGIAEDCLDRPLQGLLDEDSRAVFSLMLEQAHGGGVGRGVMRLTDRGGSDGWYDTVVSRLPRGHEWPFRFLVMCRDVTEKRGVEEAIKWQAMHDDLTGLPNRTYFQNKLSEALAVSGKRAFSILVLDVDNFKLVNDTLGHDAGDSLLITVAERLRSAVRKEDFIARLGGDEFAVILAGVATEPMVAAAALRIFDELRAPWVHNGRMADCRVSVGIALAPRHGPVAAELLKNADIALYVSKAKGRGQSSIYRPEMKHAVRRRSHEADLARHALRNALIVPYYQPKIDINTGALSGFEALLRWRKPGQRVQFPASISSAFEDLELAAEITSSMFDQVLRDVCRWRDQGFDFGHIAINLTAADLRRGGFADQMLEKLHTYNVGPQAVHVEVTETVFLGRGAEYVETALKTLSAERVRVALDDFGTGFASLSHLKQFPVDFIKIDRSFVHEMAHSPESRAIVNAIVGLGRSLGISIIAEGIETPEQEMELARAGCQFGQGYLYGKAMPASRVFASRNRPLRRHAIEF